MTQRFPRHLLACALAAFAVLALLGTGSASAGNTGGAQFVPPPPPPSMPLEPGAWNALTSFCAYWIACPAS